MAGLVGSGGDLEAVGVDGAVVFKRDGKQEEKMVSFRLLAMGRDLEGFRRIEPVGGVYGAGTTFFFKVKCTKCGGVSKDVCLRPADTQALIPHLGPCSYTVRRSSAGRHVRKHCFPTCPNSAHVVRRCKTCGSLGSVELVPGTAKLSEGSHVIATLECIGYTPLNFSPGPDWTLTTMTGENIEVGLSGDTLLGQDTENNNIMMQGVKFIFKDATI